MSRMGSSSQHQILGSQSSQPTSESLSLPESVQDSEPIEVHYVEE